MPVHDWTRVDTGVFHDFHNVWIGELRNRLNSGLLPPDCYAMSEQHAGKYVTDVLTLHSETTTEEPPPAISGGLVLAEAPPKVRRERSLAPSYRALRKTLTIRHVSGHRIVALVEIVSPGNKDRDESVEEFLNKLEDALAHDIHLLVVDLFPPGPHDPHGIPGTLWKKLGDDPEDPPAAEPLTLAAYIADSPVRAFFEYVAVSKLLPDMPLFLDPERYINVPLEAAYQATWKGTPALWRKMLEGETKNQSSPRRRRGS